MMTLRPLAALVLTAALLLSATQSHSSPLASCSNVGFSPGTYKITGTTHKITSADSIADVNALVLRSGDAVLFKAGTTWNIGAENNRLKPKQGVLYGRYGAGSNPVIVGAGVAFSVGFRGVIELDGVDDVTIDGIDVRDSDSFGIMVRNFDNVTVRNLTISNTDGGGIAFIGNPKGTNAIVDKVEIFNAEGRPHESITLDNVVGFTVSNIRSHGNGHAAMVMKGNSRNGEVYGSEFSETRDDPTLYIERSRNIHIHDNWIHTNVGSSTRKALITIGIEKFGDPAWHSVRNIEINNNVIEDAHRSGVNFFVKYDVANNPTVAERTFDNIHIHHNAIVMTGQEGLTWANAIRASDSRTPADPKDWGNIVIEDNVIWDSGVADAIGLHDGIDRAFRIRYNLFDTRGAGDLGANAVTTGKAPFVNLAKKNFDPAGAALGAGSNGSNIGAKINWSCSTSGANRPTPPLPSPTRPLPPTLISAESG